MTLPSLGDHLFNTYRMPGCLPVILPKMEWRRRTTALGDDLGDDHPTLIGWPSGRCMICHTAVGKEVARYDHR
jgi:hypothetical protein